MAFSEMRLRKSSVGMYAAVRELKSKYPDLYALSESRFKDVVLAALALNARDGLCRHRTDMIRDDSDEE